MTAFRRTLNTVADLVDAGMVRSEAVEVLERIGALYSVAVTPAMASLIDASDHRDPIARQFLPDVRELDIHPEELADPIGDAKKSPLPGIVHRYKDRVLFKLLTVCPVYCRFCFRREMVGPGRSPALSDEQIEAAICYIRDHAEIWEVIVTGGDPLVLSPRRVETIMRALDAIEHVKIVRWHSRVPAVAPERVTPELAAALASSRKTVYVALHANHPRELTDAARAACRRLINNGIAMVSQTVLLRGVNDDVETLEALMRRFVEMRVKPYYLHHGDLAPGTAHFRTTIAEGQALMHALRGRLSGLAMPTYVLDIPGAFGKVPIGPQYVHADGEAVVVTDREGVPHAYPKDSKDN